jgi:hypothetical protein
MALSLTANRIGLRRWCSVTLALALVVPLAAACTKRSPAPPGTTAHGPPISATPGHITWQLKRNADDGSYTDTFTIIVAGPA